MILTRRSSKGADLELAGKQDSYQGIASAVLLAERSKCRL
jgi:hypothetical protein